MVKHSFVSTKTADLQLYFGNIPVIGGLTFAVNISRENNPAHASSSKSSNATSVTANLPVYERNFMGYYAEWVQNYRPAEQPVHSEIRCLRSQYRCLRHRHHQGKGFSAADVMFSTTGIGWSYFWSSNVKLTAYWDIVHNEKTDPSIASNGSPLQYGFDGQCIHVPDPV